MTVTHVILILFVTLAYLYTGECLRCLHCDNIFQPRHCRTVTTCNDDEMCGSERVTAIGGNYLYNVGCFPKTTCEHNVSSTRACLQCCSSDLCNVGLCNQPDYPSPRGPICFNCQVYDKNSLCSDIDFCARDEVCNVRAKLEFSDTVYTSSCTTKSQCSPRNSVGPVIVGKRSEHMNTRTHEQEVCDVCCDSDVCNLDCDTALTDLNECHFNPCVHGTCEDSVGSFSCYCDVGFTGTTCDTAVAQLVDACLSGPCFRGTCQSQGGTFTCLCEAGYSGLLCNIDIDDCASSPCGNGTCIDEVDSYTCVCAQGLTGSQCQTDINDCASSPCSNGTCIDKVDSYTCICSPGFTGSQCQTDIDDCSSSPCGNGTCIDGINSYICICDPGLTGSQCQTHIDHCALNPCGNDTCVNMVDTFSCLHVCGPGLTGIQCQTRLSDCVDVLTNGGNTSGVYDIILNATDEVVTVYCDMDTDGGGWTVFQYRFNGSVDFYRNFSEYIYGFGNVKGEFWLGLHYIFELSKNPTVLRLDLEAASGKTAFETFTDFSLSPGSKYALHIGSSHGTAGDGQGMSYSNGNYFITFEQTSSSNCATKDHGGWWYRSCTHANLNGKYYTPGTDHNEAGVIYRSFMNELSLKSTKMMLKRDI